MLFFQNKPEELHQIHDFIGDGQKNLKFPVPFPTGDSFCY